MKKHGLFICIEGIDASGKTTHAQLLVKNLQKKGYDAIYTTEPSKGEIGSFIRKHVLQGKKRLPIAIEALLFAADRIDHLEKEVRPALLNRKVIVCDRYLYSSLAYQGAAGLEANWIEAINKWATYPDLVLLIDVPPEVVVERMNREKSVMETLENQRKVREVYIKLAKRNLFKIVNGNRSIKDVSKEILTLVINFIEKTKSES